MLIQLWRIKHDTIKKEEKRSLHDRVTHKNLRSNQDERGAITKNMMVVCLPKYTKNILFYLYSFFIHLTLIPWQWLMLTSFMRECNFLT